mmetsp:Transcript_121413/g.348875  ORF Transcript_121413/g.348875 Transcript_121413/m.348875 type:complete len:339 (-) Transcript_121413:1267-2283(-)
MLCDSQAHPNLLFGLALPLGCMGIKECLQTWWHEIGVLKLGRLGLQEALQRSVDREAEDGHEDARDEVAHEDEHEHWHNRGDLLVHGAHEEVPHQRGARRDAHEADVVDDGAQDGHRPEAEGVVHDEGEGLRRGNTEILSHERDLDVCILVQELDALLETPQTTLNLLEHDRHEPVLLRLSLLLQVLHHIPDELHKRHDGRPERHGAKVIPEDRLHGTQQHRRLGLLSGEEPNTHREGDDDLAQGNDEGVVPQEDEEGDRKANVEDVARWGTTPAFHDAYTIKDLLDACIVLPDGARRPLVGALAGRGDAMVAGLPNCAWVHRAPSLSVGREIARRRV